MPEENNTGTATQQETEVKPLFSGTDSQGKERLFTEADDAAKSWQNSQDHIKTLESKTKEYEDMITSLKTQLDQQQSTSSKVDEALDLLKQKGNDDMSTAETTNPVDIEALTQKLISEAQKAATTSVTNFEQQKIAQNNQDESIGAAKKFYGSEYEAKLRESGMKLGLNDEAVVAMARSNPSLFRQTFGLNGTPPKGVSPDGSINAALFGGKPPEIQPVSKFWGTTAKSKALGENMAAVEKMLESTGGDVDAVRQALGINKALNN